MKIHLFLAATIVTVFTYSFYFKLPPRSKPVVAEFDDRTPLPDTRKWQPSQTRLDMSAPLFDENGVRVPVRSTVNERTNYYTQYNNTNVVVNSAPAQRAQSSGGFRRVPPRQGIPVSRRVPNTPFPR